jgi:outer membrane protein assembly factor BamB
LLKWEYKGVSLYSQPVVGEDGTIYFGGYSYLYAVDQNGNLKWRKNLGEGALLNNPLVGADGTVYCIGREYLYALNANDGSIKWRYQTADYPTNGTLALSSNGILYAWLIYDNSWFLHAIKAESGGLANSSWPKYQHDNQCTGCVGGF